MNKNSILVVDDDKDFRNLIADYLEEEGFNTLQAENGAIALKHIEREIPDLILLDIQMPLVNGLDVCRILKAKPSTSAIPVIIVSGSNALSDMLTSYITGVIRFLAKPFELGELGECVRKVLHLRDNMMRQIDDMFSQRFPQGSRITPFIPGNSRFSSYE